MNIQDLSYRNRDKLQNSRLWNNKPPPRDKYIKAESKEIVIPEYQAIKNKNPIPWILRIFPTNRVFDLKLSLIILSVLFIILFAILYYLYLKSKKII